MARCPDHERELSGADRSCPFCHGCLVDAASFERRFGAVRFAPETRDDSSAFDKTRVCPDCRVPMLPQRIGELEAWVERCPRCEARWVESSDLRSIELLGKRLARAKAWTAMPAPQREEIARDLARETAPDPSSIATELRGGETLKAFIGVPIIAGARGEGGPFGTVALLLLVTLAFAAGLLRPEGELFAEWGWKPGSGLSVTLLTAPWVHAGWGQLLGNLFFLWPFGDLIERRLGTVKLLGFYVLAGVLSTLAQGLLSPAGVPIGGASGAIFALMGAAVLLQPAASMKLTIPGLIGAYRIARGGTTTFPALRVRLWVGVALYGAFQLLLLAFDTEGGSAWGTPVSGLALGLVAGARWRRRDGAAV
jgi:membrane associated rhomboid family serine protease